MASWLFPETAGLDAAFDFDALDLDAYLEDFDLVEGNDTFDGDAIDDVGSNTGQEECLPTSRPLEHEIDHLSSKV